MLSGIRVLIVEDEALVAATLSDAVENAGGEVVSVSHTVSEARELIRRLTFDVAVLDLHLPDGDAGSGSALRPPHSHRGLQRGRAAGEGQNVKRHRRLTPCSGRTTPWFSDTKWKFGGVTIDADDDPAAAMSSGAKSYI